MTRRHLVVACALWFMMGAANAQSPAAADADAEKRRVLDAVKTLRDAIRTGDAIAAERVLAPQVSIYEQGHVEASRAEYMGHHFKEDAAYAKLVASTVVAAQAQVDGAVAVVTATSNSEGTYQDKPVKSTSVETYVLRLRQGTWQIEHIHWSSRKR